MNEAQAATASRPRSVLLIVLATIGGLALLTMVAFFLAVFWMTKGGVSVPAVSRVDKLGILEVKGVIAESEETLKTLREFRDRADVKGVVVRIDSPGGAVGASQEIYEELRRLDKEKPVVASLATVAASGGYYVSIGARHIVADPGTVTGSIGVIMKIPNVGALLEKLGIKTTVVKSGALKDLGSVTRDLTEEEKGVLEGVLRDVHEQFVGAVAESRELSKEEVAALADGRIMSGRQALDASLVDELGNFSVACDRAAALAGIEGTPELLYPRKDKLSLLRQLMEEEGAKSLLRILNQLLGASAYGTLS